MKDNTVLLNAALVIMSILLFMLILFKGKQLENKIDEYNKYSEANSIFKERSYSNNGPLSNNFLKDKKIIMDRITALELEVLRIKNDNNKMAKQYEEKNFIPSENNLGANNLNINNLSDSNFKHVLNYKFFKEKNNDIINLYEQGRAIEEIAKVLNKSIREVEMVINLIK